MQSTLKKQRKKKGKHRHNRIHRIVKAIRYLIGRRIIRVIFSIPHVLSLSRAVSLSSAIVKVGYYFTGVYRRQALANLRLFFGKEKSYAELKDLATKIGIEVAKGAIESVYLVSPRREELFTLMHIEGKEYLDGALGRGKGVIALSAHLGNFAIMGGKLLSEGYPFHLVLKLPKDPVIGEYFKTKMEQYNFNFIQAEPTSVAQKGIIRCLRRNEIVCLIADGDQKTGGIPVDLIGQEVAIPPGPAILAMRTGATILPMFIIRQPDNSHKIIIEPPVEIPEDASSDGAVPLLTLKFVRIIESYIRQYPAQWYWVNKKHRHNQYRKKPKVSH